MSDVNILSHGLMKVGLGHRCLQISYMHSGSKKIERFCGNLPDFLFMVLLNPLLGLQALLILNRVFASLSDYVPFQKGTRGYGKQELSLLGRFFSCFRKALLTFRVKFDKIFQVPSLMFFPSAR